MLFKRPKTVMSCTKLCKILTKLTQKTTNRKKVVNLVRNKGLWEMKNQNHRHKVSQKCKNLNLKLQIQVI